MTSQPPAVADREALLAETFVRLADTLVDDYDVVELLDQLVGACLALLDVTAAGLLLDDQRGTLAVVASSTEETHVLETLQIQHSEGPCWDCFRTGEVVTSTDLHAELQRWPLFAPAAVGAGFHAVAAVPLRLRNETLGALNLFQNLPRPLPSPQVRLAQALADVATIAILQRRSTHRSTMIAEQLQAALQSRVVVEQAKGVLRERHEIGMDTAFQMLRKHARDHNLKLTAVSLAVVRGELDLGRLVEPPARG